MSKPHFVVDTHNRYGERLKIRYESKKGLNLDLCMELAEIARKHKQSLFKADEKIDMDLIAAAPDLLEITQELIRHMESAPHFQNPYKIIARAEKIIKKAKGVDINAS